MSVNRHRKDAARIVALEMQKRYDALVAAQDEDEIREAALNLGMLFNDNIEIMIWALRKAGGLNALPSDLPKMPLVLQ